MIQLNDIKSKLKANSLFLPFYVLAFLMLASCAKMGQPDGGWFDETPPDRKSTRLNSSHSRASRMPSSA